MNKPHFLEVEGAFAHYDEIKHIAFIVYSGELTAQTTTQVYEWMTGLLQNKVAPAQVSGCVFDFQKVTYIEARNLFISQVVSEEINQKFDLSSIPVALIVAPNMIQDTVQQILEQSPQPGRKQMVSSIDAAFEFLSQFRQEPPQSAVHMLDTPHVTGHFDEARHLAYITYYDVVTADVTADVYAWMGRVIEHYGGEVIHYCVFDFRKVSRFDATNTRRVSQTSERLNINYDLSHVPVALIVRDDAQGRLISLTMHLTPQERRKRLVRSAEEAWAFMSNYKQEMSQNPTE